MRVQVPSKAGPAPMSSPSHASPAGRQPPTLANSPHSSHSFSAVDVEAPVLQAKLIVGAIDDPLEQEADRVAEQVMRGPAASALVSPAPVLLRRTCAECGGGCPKCQSEQARSHGQSFDPPVQSRSGRKPRLALAQASIFAEPRAFRQPPPSVGSTADKTLAPRTQVNEEDEPYEDQKTSVSGFNPITISKTIKGTSITTYGVSITVQAMDTFTSSTYPDGFKFTQTIDTNAPYPGASPPYVDPQPKGFKPFYYTDAEQATSGGTFTDKPNRPPPKTGTKVWDAVLCLNGVDEAHQRVRRFDCLTYGFSLDTAGKVTLHSPGSSFSGIHLVTLEAAFPGWTFL